MSLVVEDGTGKADAESYASVADADAYIAKYASTAGATAWAAAVTATKEQHLRLATRYLELAYRWIGSRNSETQALHWPIAEGEFDRDGFEIDDNVIPVNIVRATAETALRSLQGSTLLGDIDSDDAELRSERVKVGPVELEQQFASVKSTAVRFTAVDALLQGLVFASGELRRA